MKIIFVRHGESEANTGGKTELPESINLTSRGIEQSKELLNKIPREPDLIIVTSHLRTSQTAGGLIKAYPNVPVEIWPLHEFTFLSPELCKDTTLSQRAPLVRAFWDRCDPSYIHGEGAESFDQFIARIKQGVNGIASLDYKYIVVFTHGHVIRAVKMIFEHALVEPSGTMQYYRDSMLKLAIPNACLYEICFNEV